MAHHLIPENDGTPCRYREFFIEGKNGKGMGWKQALKDLFTVEDVADEIVGSFKSVSGLDKPAAATDKAPLLTPVGSRRAREAVKAASAASHSLKQTRPSEKRKRTWSILTTPERASSTLKSRPMMHSI